MVSQIILTAPTLILLKTRLFLPPLLILRRPRRNLLPLNISYKVYRETFRDDDGTDLVDFKLTYPYIDNPDNAQGITAINEYYETQLDHFITTVIPEGKKAAMEFKKVAQENGFDFYPLAFEREPSIYYNGNNLLSVLNLDFENTGGAHPNSYWSSETFDVETGKMLTLSDIFGVSKEEVLEKVYEIVINQIEQAKSKDNYGEDVYYFDEYEENAKNYYSENDFVLGPKGIIFYYQLYTLAPYAAGFPPLNFLTMKQAISPLRYYLQIQTKMK